MRGNLGRGIEHYFAVQQKLNSFCWLAARVPSTARGFRAYVSCHADREYLQHATWYRETKAQQSLGTEAGYNYAQPCARATRRRYSRGKASSLISPWSPSGGGAAAAKLPLTVFARRTPLKNHPAIPIPIHPCTHEAQRDRCTSLPTPPSGSTTLGCGPHT